MKYVKLQRLHFAVVINNLEKINFDSELDEIKMMLYKMQVDFANNKLATMKLIWVIVNNRPQIRRKRSIML